MKCHRIHCRKNGVYSWLPEPAKLLILTSWNFDMRCPACKVFAYRYQLDLLFFHPAQAPSQASDRVFSRFDKRASTRTSFKVFSVMFSTCPLKALLWESYAKTKCAPPWECWTGSQRSVNPIWRLNPCLLNSMYGAFMLEQLLIKEINNTIRIPARVLHIRRIENCSFKTWYTSIKTDISCLSVPALTSTDSKRGLTPTPQAFYLSAEATARVLRFIAAFTSLSIDIPQLLQW